MVLRTPTMHYAYQGFIYEGEDKIKIEIYENGQALFSLYITQDTVCSGMFNCINKASLNEQALSPFYPDNIIENIFRGQPLMDGKNVVKEDNGFTQKLTNGNKYNIVYSVLNHEMTFHDTINHIVMKIKKSKG
ncbi:MAG: hypothetical protein LGB73_00885 [Sulfurovum sp.]|nr:hypothetical protein [Sulfurovum sp.]